MKVLKQIDQHIEVFENIFNHPFQVRLGLRVKVKIRVEVRVLASVKVKVRVKVKFRVMSAYLCILNILNHPFQVCTYVVARDNSSCKQKY
jgi:hypothetical protein